MRGRRSTFEPRTGIGWEDTRMSALATCPAVLPSIITTLFLGGIVSFGCGDTAEPADTVSPDDAAAEDASDGTAEGGACVGTPEPCESFLNYTTCQQQRGCGWVFAYNECRPNFPTGPYACDQFSRPDSCGTQVGCWWE